MQFRYQDPNRMYHSLTHIHDMFDFAHKIGIELTIPQYLGIWYHDAVIDFKRNKPENDIAESLVVFDNHYKLGYLDEWELSKTEVDTIVRIIFSTLNHNAIGEQAKIVVDLDLAILASPHDRYNEYVRKIRDEYFHLSDDEWRAGRTDVLNQFLDRPSIFSSSNFLRFNNIAVSNIKQELESLK